MVRHPGSFGDLQLLQGMQNVNFWEEVGRVGEV